ncbi:MAG: manganese efflux pump [Candidatus Borkfalkiaceae bacterium]|nr:manganese efflux pump [Christensenellaceae bacterium]
MDFAFFLNSVLLGVGLSMDAFSVSLANGLNEPNMKRGKRLMIAGTFSFFQALMPMTGWLLVTTLLGLFNVISPFIPYVALILLGFIGGKMIYDGLKTNSENKENESDLGGNLTADTLILQGVATSIDALSVGFTIEIYPFLSALVCSLIIAAVTFGICIAGVHIGKKFGMKLADKSQIFGGVILIAIGIEIFIKGII